MTLPQVLLFVLFPATFTTLATEIPTEAEIAAGLSSPKIADRRVAAHALAANASELHSLDAPSLAVRGLGDSDAGVRVSLLQALDTWMAVGESRQSVIAWFQQNSDVRELILGLMRSEDEEEGLAAAMVYAKATPESAASERVLLDQLTTAKSERVFAHYVRLVAQHGLAASESQEFLLRTTKEAPSRKSVEAAQALVVVAEPPPVELLPELVRLAESAAFFAKPKLVEGIGMYGAGAADYLPRLEAMRAELLRELTAPDWQRTLPIHNDEFYVRTLDRTLALVRTGQRSMVEEQ